MIIYFFPRKTLPEMPEDLRQKIVRDFSLPLEFAVRFVNDPPLLHFFLQAVEYKPKNNKVCNVENLTEHKSNFGLTTEPNFIQNGFESSFNRIFDPN